MILKGRRKILNGFRQSDLIDIENVVSVINDAMDTHLANKSEIDYLKEYRAGIQPILYKEKVIRDEINNKLVANHAQMATRNILGYFLGNPIQYIQADGGNKEEVDMLNKFVAYEDKSLVDQEIGELQSITGTAYRIIYTDGLLADEVPFEDKSLDPGTTFVVYENNIAEKPLLGVTYYTITGNDGEELVRYHAYTEFGEFVITSESHIIDLETSFVDFNEYYVGGIPIVEYPNNRWRIGDWELCIGLMDAINAMHSGRLDDIDQIIQSLIIFVNAEIDGDTYDEMRERGVVILKNTTDSKTDVKTIVNSLDQAGMSMFAEEMEELLYALLGIPSRKTRGGGGGDTGQAVELRDGWADLEIIARNKEATFKKSEKQSLKIMLTIMNNRIGTSLSLLDLDVKFTRNKNNNLLVKTQSFATLLATKALAPEDCLSIVDLVSDVNEYVARGKAFWGDQFAGKMDTQVPPPVEEGVENEND